MPSQPLHFHLGSLCWSWGQRSVGLRISKSQIIWDIQKKHGTISTRYDMCSKNFKNFILTLVHCLEKFATGCLRKKVFTILNELAACPWPRDRSISSPPLSFCDQRIALNANCLNLVMVVAGRKPPASCCTALFGPWTWKTEMAVANLTLKTHTHCSIKYVARVVL
jgi:hypothetical protein